MIGPCIQTLDLKGALLQDWLVQKVVQPPLFQQGELLPLGPDIVVDGQHVLIDAALWIGYTGLVGLYGVADILVGNENPSGRLVDTYCNDNTTNPAMVNFYSQIWSNAEALGATYDASTGKWKGGGLMTGSSGSAALVHTWHEEMDTETFSVSAVTGEPIVNRFQSGDLDFYGGERMKCVSRSDWKGTFPTVKLELELTEAMQKEMTGIKQYEKIVVDGEQMPTLGSTATSHKLSDMVELAYDDPKWEELLDQLTYEELCNLIGVGYHGTIHLDSVSKPETHDENGPQGFSANLTDLTGNAVTLCAYTDENIMAATWNVELMEEVGEHIGEDGLWAGYSGLYGPAMNTHRTAYAGRNFEYYSEDGFLGGKIAAAEVKGIQSKGVYVFLKHFALNDCETNCRSISTFVNEQAMAYESAIATAADGGLDITVNYGQMGEKVYTMTAEQLGLLG